MISFIKYKNDLKRFKVLKAFGANVIELEHPDDVDKKIQELYKNNCKNIILSNEIANFSEDVIKKYKSSENISIIIAPRK